MLTTTVGTQNTTEIRTNRRIYWGVALVIFVALVFAFGFRDRGTARNSSTIDGMNSINPLSTIDSNRSDKVEGSNLILPKDSDNSESLSNPNNRK